MDRYLERIVVHFPQADPVWSAGLLRLFDTLGENKGGVLQLGASEPDFYPKLQLDFHSRQPDVQVDFVLSQGETITIPVANLTGEERKSPHSYGYVSLAQAVQQLERSGIHLVGIDHAGFNLPWFSSEIHPRILKLRDELAPFCLYHLFPSGEPWDFIIPGDRDEISRRRPVDYTRARWPKFEIVSFEKASTPLVQFDVQLNASYEALKALFPGALDDPGLRNLWIYLEISYGVDVCLVANETSQKDWSGYFAGSRI